MRFTRVHPNDRAWAPDAPETHACTAPRAIHEGLAAFSYESGLYESTWDEANDW